MKLLLALVATVTLSAQITVSADLLSPATTAAMFGKLPKQYAAASVSICNDGVVTVFLPLARAAQQVRISGVALLPKDAAISVLASAQGGTTAAKMLRGGVVAVQLAALAAGWSGLGVTARGVLTSSSVAGSAALGIVSTQIPTHTLMAFVNEALPDLISVPAAGCSSGIVIVEKVKELGLVQVISIRGE